MFGVIDSNGVLCVCRLVFLMVFVGFVRRVWGSFCVMEVWLEKRLGTLGRCGYNNSGCWRRGGVNGC